jgi:hypothetical protein
MATVKQVVGSPTALTVTGFSTLASATYVASAVYNNITNQPLDLMIEVTAATTNTPAGNKQVVVFAKASYDNSNWQSGPVSGTTTTDEPDLTFLGVLPLATASTTERKSFSVASAYGGVLPPYVNIVLKNDLGVVLTSGSVLTAEISATVA